MKKGLLGSGLLAVAVIAAVSFYERGSAEWLNPKRIHIERMEEANLPYEADAWKDTEASLGTEENPFVILELVPNEEKLPGEAGYLVSGCEPVEINSFETKARVEEFAKLNTPLFGFTNKIFLEEWEADTFPSSWKREENEQVTLFGYYERVEEGEGDFAWKEEKEWNAEASYSVQAFEKKTGKDASWVWHTTESFDKEDAQKRKRQEKRLETWEVSEDTEQTGCRIYAYRTDTGCYNGGESFLYTHYDDFLRTSLGLLDEEKRENFYVCVKTVTAKELNAIYTKESLADKENWLQAANLIYVVGENGTADYSGENDLHWKTVLAVMKRVAGDELPAAFWADSRILQSEYTPLDTRKEGVVYHAFDWDGKYQEYPSRTATGSNNHLFKLGIMLTRWDAGLFYSYFLQNSISEEESLQGGWIDENGNLRADEERNGGYLSAEEREYWGVGSFLPTAQGVDAEEIWETYHVDVNSEVITSNYIYKNIFFYKLEGSSLIQAGLSNMIDNRDRFHKDFFAYLEEKGIEPVGGGYIENCFLGMNYILADTLAAENSIKKNSIRILDLEPCNDFTTLTDFKVKAMLSNVQGKIENIEIVQQTTAEFIGRIEDLNSTYDMIYLGMADGALRKSKKNGTEYIDYNDDALDNYIYLHVGDYVIQGDASLAVDWITRSRLEEYWQEKNIQVSGFEKDWLGREYIRLPGNDITERKKEALLDYAAAGYPVILSADFKKMCAEDSLKKVDTASNIYALVTEIQEKENVYYDDEMESFSTLTQYLKQRVLEIELLNAPAEYTEGMAKEGYLQAETSGIYKDTYLLSYEFRLKAGQTGKTYTARLYLDQNRDGRFSADEVVANKKGLKTSKKLFLSARVSKEWFGAIPWQLEVSEENGTQRAAVTGICIAERTADTPKKQIEVLQIMQSQVGKRTIDLKAKEFSELMQGLEDYEIKVSQTTTTAFEAWFREADTEEERTKLENELSKYSMLVFGFADSYSNISNEDGALEWVKAYAAAGKNILFTHDNTSFFNKKPTDSGYNFTLYFRGIMGMDRFDIRYQLHRKETDPKKRVASAGVTDTAYVLNDRSKVYSQQQGYTYYAARRITNKQDELSFAALSESKRSNFPTNAVENVNKGQITCYPYAIEDSFTTAETHAQYYQLNMENEDIVVWYTLKNGGVLHGNTYDCSPRDTSNNYYIYNKGNITYTGIGHSGGTTETERKLLINTIISAYKPDDLPPSIEFPDADYVEEGSDQTRYYDAYLNVDYGSSQADLTEEESSWVAFIPTAPGKIEEKLSVGVYQIHPAGKETVLCTVKDEEGNVLGEEAKATVLDENGEEQEVWLLEKGITYYAKYQRTTLEEEDLPKLKFTIEKTDGETKGKPSVLTLRRRELFLLD